MTGQGELSPKEQPVAVKISKIYAIFDFNSKYPISTRISRILSISDIINLTRTCKAFAHLYKSLLSSQWNIDKRLARFVNNITSFRSQMASFNALISGSFALQFFDRVRWSGSDLDISIREKADEFEHYLCHVEGYQRKRTTYGARYDMTGVDKVRTLIRRPANAPKTQIQLCISNCPPAEQILTGYYATHVVNFISWNKAYALFPRPTFAAKKAYMLQKLDDQRGKNLAKYRKRGWRIQDVVWEGEDAVPALEGLRRVGDHHTWIIPLDTSGVEVPRTPDFVLEHAGFMIKKSSDAQQDIDNGLSHMERYEINTKRVGGEVLKFEYLCGSLEWSRFLTDRVLRLTELELFKENPDLRPHNFRELIEYPSSPRWQDFPKTVRWTYYDEEVPTWYAQWLAFHGAETKGK